MKRIIVLMVLVTLLLSIPTCSLLFEQEDSAAIDSAKLVVLRDVERFKVSDDIIPLLSIKYSLDPDIANKIIYEFRTNRLTPDILLILEAKTVEDIEMLTPKKDSLSVEDRVQLISKEWDVPPTVIASLIIDYKIWYEVSNAE